MTKTKEFDLKKIISDAVEKISKDEDLQKQFMKEPVKALEKVLNIDLPDELIEKVVDGIKAKITADKLSDAAGMLKKLF